eukprot:COSAG01_NODE_12902_length_1667_cov_1.878189_3_plen_170_part_00
MSQPRRLPARSSNTTAQGVATAVAAAHAAMLPGSCSIARWNWQQPATPSRRGSPTGGRGWRRARRRAPTTRRQRPTVPSPGSQWLDPTTSSTVPDRPHRARSIIISMGSVLLPADRSSKQGAGHARAAWPPGGRRCSCVLVNREKATGYGIACIGRHSPPPCTHDTVRS